MKDILSKWWVMPLWIAVVVLAVLCYARIGQGEISNEQYETIVKLRNGYPQFEKMIKEMKNDDGKITYAEYRTIHKAYEEVRKKELFDAMDREIKKSLPLLPYEQKQLEKQNADGN